MLPMGFSPHSMFHKEPRRVRKHPSMVQSALCPCTAPVHCIHLSEIFSRRKSHFHGRLQDRSKPLGCSSLRRTLQLRELYPDMEVASVRGNLQTRLRKLDEGQYSALILAAAGLKRLGLESRISRYFTEEEMLPAAGQGILAVQGRTDVDYAFLDGYCDADAWSAGSAERAFVRFLDGGCSSPVAAFGVVEGEELFLRGLYYNEETGNWFKDSIRGKREDAEVLGIALAKQMKESDRTKTDKGEAE